MTLVLGRLVWLIVAAIVATVASCATAHAQTLPIIPVLGVGELVLEVPTDVATANLQDYGIYVDTRARLLANPTCVQKPGTTTPPVSQCPIPLASLNLTGAHQIAVTAIIVAADGELESPRGTIPFVLRRVAAPVAPALPSSSVRPVPQP
jgi:hypothetical protein